MLKLIPIEDTRNIRSERKYEMTSHEKGWKKRLESVKNERRDKL